jgi:uncharacterized protein
VDWSGKGSFERTMRGIECLKKENVPFGLLSVLTDYSLSHSKELFDFYYLNDFCNVSFNSEEVEGANKTSSLEFPDSINRYYNFLSELWQYIKNSDKEFIIREFANILDSILFRAPDIIKSEQNAPFRIISITSNGDFSTFSPELLTIKNEVYSGKDFILGNVFHTSFEESLNLPKFHEIYDDISKGYEECKNTCEYFFRCGGGSPVAKFMENKTFNSSETLFCKLKYQLPSNVVLNDLEETLFQ